ncbi:MAG: phytoene desaturase family protein [Pseudonocardiaceae bacterium]
MTPVPDAVVVGSGPNGLAAALTLAGAGLSVRVLEGADTPGGGARSAELTLPGVVHDECSAVHPLAAASPFFRDLDLAAHGVMLRRPPVAFAHPLDGGRAGALRGSVADTAARLGADGTAYRRLLAPLVDDAGRLLPELLTPPLRRVPRHPAALARFALRAALPAAALITACFSGEEARALLAGAAAHAVQPMNRLPTGPFGLLLTLLGHTTGWPVVQGGSGRLVDAMVAELRRRGAEVVTGHWVRSLAELSPAHCVLLDVTPRQLLSLAGDVLPRGYAAALAYYRYGPGVCKVDYTLSEPVPWTAPSCREAGTVHVGGAWREVHEALVDVHAGRHPQRPFVLVAQPDLADPTRAPAGRHTLWTYCHVPAGSPRDMTAAIERQLERFAPGFRDVVLARHVRTAEDTEAYSPNYVGGDIGGGATTVWQTLFRPVPRWDTYATPLDGVFLCSSSTPPGGGVHGMCGVHAARSALRRRFAIRSPPARE